MTHPNDHLVAASKEARALAPEVRETVSAAQARENRARERRSAMERASGVSPASYSLKPEIAASDEPSGPPVVEGEHDGAMGASDE